MSLKTCALLAFLGSLLLTILLTVDLVSTILGIARGILPAIALVRALIYDFASFTLTIFLCVFRSAQSR